MRNEKHGHQEGWDEPCGSEITNRLGLAQGVDQIDRAHDVEDPDQGQRNH